jgi:hypothetical protein
LGESALKNAPAAFGYSARHVKRGTGRLNCPPSSVVGQLIPD